MLLRNTETKQESEEFYSIGESQPDKEDNGFYNILNATTNVVVQDALSRFINAQGLDITQENMYYIRTQTDKEKAIYSQLDQNYIQKNGITLENLEQIMPSKIYNDLVVFEIKEKAGTRVNNYLLHVGVKEQTNQGELAKEKMYLIRLDTQNSTYSVEPLSDDNMNTSAIQIDEYDSEIPDQSYNKYTNQVVSTQMVAQQYFVHFKNLVINYPTVAYEKFFAEDYKTKRFGNIENFVRYVQLNAEEIEQLRAEKYKIETENGHQKYILQDQYQNTYEFIENYTMDYTAKLDTYTIPASSVELNYNNATETEKISLNVDRFVKMLNSRDYYQLYNLLNQTYRNTNFPTYEEFENYMKTSFKAHYTCEILDSREQGETYILAIHLDSIENDTYKDMNLMMRLQDGLDFEISFEK